MMSVPANDDTVTSAETPASICCMDGMAKVEFVTSSRESLGEGRRMNAWISH
jgi:hypothetical protein